jgi:hypothetical protein
MLAAHPGVQCLRNLLRPRRHSLLYSSFRACHVIAHVEPNRRIPVEPVLWGGHVSIGCEFVGRHAKARDP